MEPYPATPVEVRVEWAVRCWGRIQTTTLVGGGTITSHFICTTDVTEQLIVHMPKRIVLDAARRVGMMQNFFNQKEIESLRVFLQGQRAKIRYRKESTHDGVNKWHKYTAVVTELG